MHVYIAGLGHSGTTFLQLLLSSHSSMFGLGEIIQTIDYINGSREDHNRCSCHQSIYDCDFWRGLAGRNSQPEIYLEDVLERFREKKDDLISIDTSKDPDYLERYHEAGISSNKIKTIFLVRDYRGWVSSQKRWHQKRRPAEKSWLNRNFFIWSYKWFERNYKLENTLQKLCNDYILVRYEDLVFSTQKAVTKILKYLDLPKENLSLADQEVHDVYGNPMKNDSEKSDSIYYDDRWLTRETSWLYGWFIYPVVKKNCSFAERSLETVNPGKES